MSKNVMDMEGPKRTGVWVVFKDGKNVGKIIAAYPAQGHGERRTYVQVFDWTHPSEGPRIAHAGGFGYDKVQHAMESLGFGGLQLSTSTSWETTLTESGYTVLEVL
jgi:hypothetical protein